MSDFVKLYPNAKVVGPKGLVSKRKDLKFDIVQPDSPLDPELDKEFKAIPMTGHPNEVSFEILQVPHYGLLDGRILFAAKPELVLTLHAFRIAPIRTLFGITSRRER